MTETQPSSCLTIGELADYWTADASPDDIERIEAHVFACADCARTLGETDQLRRSIVAAVQAGAFQAFVDDRVLNLLARDGIRVRTYTVEPGMVIPCAIWSGDEVLVTRLRADFSGVESVTALMYLETGEEVQRSVDVPVGQGTRELIMAIPAATVRMMPAARIRLTLVGKPAPEQGEILGEYVFDHSGSHARGS